MEVRWQHGCWLVVVKVMAEVVVPIDPALNINRVCFFVVVVKSVHTHAYICTRQRHAMQASGHAEQRVHMHACVADRPETWILQVVCLSHSRWLCFLAAFHPVVGQRWCQCSWRTLSCTLG